MIGCDLAQILKTLRNIPKPFNDSVSEYEESNAPEEPDLFPAGWECITFVCKIIQELRSKWVRKQKGLEIYL